ncbi:MAG: replication restart helicase PriA [Candidatus Saccharimonadales bacterium]
MIYYHVWVRSPLYRGSEALTYRFKAKLKNGSLVVVPLRKQTVLGVVAKSVAKPSFSTKLIISAFNLPPLPITTLGLASWLKLFYPSALGIITQQFLPRVINPSQLVEPINIDSSKIKIFDQPPLTKDQILALKQIKKPDTYMLHGRTGSGKTRIYTELSKRTLRSGKSVLVLSPEIGLTSQLAVNFRQLFGNQVLVLHSQLTTKEHNKTWLTVLKATKPIVVIGPRSALFSPIKKLGLIIVDECHDQAYKQEQPPYYHAIRVASQLSHIHHATLILGSATPAVTDYYIAKDRKKTIIQLDELARPLSFERKITIVDLKDRDQFSRTPHLSLPLIKSMASSLEKNEQALLYLNRRGTARVTLCQNCGWQAACPHCDLPLTYHNDSYKLRCHVCGYNQSPATNCPSCGNTEITLHGFGTKAIVDEVSRVFPEARIMRFDTDNLKSERLENQYQGIINGNVDILIGTQVLVKGLDLPLLSTLGVILADSSLYIPDYTAQERTYQLLTQVLGRIGRGHIKSQAIIQTYNPDSLLLKSSIQNDWQSFYNTEIKERQRYFFPPFCHLLKLNCRRVSSASAEKAALSFKEQLNLKNLRIQIEGPAPAFHEKVGSKYIWQLIIKAKKRSDLLAVTKLLPTNGWSYDLDPMNLL